MKTETVSFVRQARCQLCGLKVELTVTGTPTEAHPPKMASVGWTWTFGTTGGLSPAWWCAECSGSEEGEGPKNPPPSEWVGLGDETDANQ